MDSTMRKMAPEVETPEFYEIDSDHISINMEGSKVYQEKFLEIIKYYNDVVMTNTIVFPEDELLKNERIIKKMNDERDAINPRRPKVRVNTNNRFFQYTLTKVNDLQKQLSDYDKQLSFFYNRYKRTYDLVSIATIICSSSLSFIEGVTLLYEESNTPSTIVSLCVSSSIAIMTSVLKFKNIKEKLEEIVKTKEKVGNCQARLFTFDKEIKTSLFINDNL